MKLVMRIAKGTSYFVLVEFPTGRVLHTEDVLALWSAMLILAILFFTQSILAGGIVIALLGAWVAACLVRHPWTGQRSAFLQAEWEGAKR